MKIIFLIMFSILQLCAVEYTDVTYNKLETRVEMPDENATSLIVRKYFDRTSTINRTNFDSTEALLRFTQDDGSFKFQVSDSNDTNVTSYAKIQVPQSCIDNGTEDTLIDVYMSSYEVITDRQAKRIALELPIALDSVQRHKNNYKIDSTKCVEVFTTSNPTGQTICGGCADSFVPTIVSYDSNKSAYLPNNQRLKNNFQHNSNDNKALSLIQKMHNNNEIGRRINFANPGTIKPNELPEDLKDSRDANISKKSAELVETISITQIRQKLTKCFVRRELVPKFYCPIPGMEFGAKTGGNPEDNLVEAKAQCDSYCESQSYSCKSLDTGYDKNITSPLTVSFDFTTAYKDMTKQDVEVLINNNLEVKQITYEINLAYNTDTNLTELIGRDATVENAQIYINVKVSYRQEGSLEYVDFTGASLFEIASTSNKIIIPKLPRAEAVKLTFYKPTVKKDGIFMDVEESDIIKEVSAENISIEYSDNKYHFCSLQQLIIDPSTQCLGGESFEITSGAENFIVCKSDTRMQGPEPIFGGYYSEESCLSNCKIKHECVEIFSHYTDSNSSEAAYKITVGCVDDPFNQNCSKAQCEEYFRDNTIMPVEEVVYDTRRKVRRTVVAGAQLANEYRPKIILDDEYAAQASTDKVIAYESVFLNEMKDQAYQNMISERTYDYSKDTVSISTNFENAYREEEVYSGPSGEYNANITESEFFWKLKPESHHIKDGKSYYIYKIAKTEQVFRPISGSFQEDGYLTNYPRRAYKDMVFSYISDSGNTPFYIEEYAQVFRDGNVSDGEPNGWSINSQHAENKYIKYNVANDMYVTGSGDEIGVHYLQTQFDGSKNYEEFPFLYDPTRYFTKLQDGASIQSQTTDNQGFLPVKHYSIASLMEAKNSGIINYHFYGIYSETPLTNRDILEMVNGEEKDKYLIYRSTLAKANKTEIYGDGKMKKEGIRMFIKGQSNSLSLSVELEPQVEEEGKDIIMFMFMFEGEI